MALGVNPLAGKQLKRVELESFTFFGVLDARLAKIFDNHLAEFVGAVNLQRATVAKMLAPLLFLGDTNRAMPRQTLDRKRPGDADPLFVNKRFIEKNLGVAVRRHG